jgi:hypothetical protein
MTHTAESPASVGALNRAQETCQDGKLTIKELPRPRPAINSPAAYAVMFLGRRFGLSPRRAHLVAELAGMGGAV